MLNNSPFYRQSIKRHAVAFMSLFTDIAVQRFDANNALLQTVKVPIAYGPREKYVELLRANPDLDRPVGITMPRMACEITSLSYDQTRKFNSTKMLSTYSANTPSDSAFTFVPIPVDIGWRLSVMTRTSDDANQIVEQILPFFSPEWVNRVRLIDELGIEFNIPVIFLSAQINDNYDNSPNQSRRILTWTMNFKMKGYLIGPPNTSALIKIAQINISDQSNTTMFQVTTTPGMTANGQPTTNPADSVNPLTIKFDDDWAFATDSLEYPNIPSQIP